MTHRLDHSQMGSRPVCRYHAKPGGCRYGPTCRFAHPPEPLSALGVRSPGHQATASVARTPATSFSKLVPQDEYLAGVLHGTCRTFLARGKVQVWDDLQAPPRQNKDDEASAAGPRQVLEYSEYLAGVPHGTCRNFWHEGRCTFGTSCKHCHDRTKDDEVLTNRQRRAPQPSAPMRLADQELTAIASGGSSDAVAG